IQTSLPDCTKHVAFERTATPAPVEKAACHRYSCGGCADQGDKLHTRDAGLVEHGPEQGERPGRRIVENRIPPVVDRLSMPDADQFADEFTRDRSPRWQRGKLRKFRVQ